MSCFYNCFKSVANSSRNMLKVCIYSKRTLLFWLSNIYTHQRALGTRGMRIDVLTTIIDWWTEMTWLYSLFLINGTHVSIWHALAFAVNGFKGFVCRGRRIVNSGRQSLEKFKKFKSWTINETKATTKLNERSAAREKTCFVIWIMFLSPGQREVVYFWVYIYMLKTQYKH